MPFVIGITPDFLRVVSTVRPERSRHPGLLGTLRQAGWVTILAQAYVREGVGLFHDRRSCRYWLGLAPSAFRNAAASWLGSS